jgi:Bacteriophage tail sheath protein
MVYSYPGVYVKELPSTVHTITGVATSIAAFVGYTTRGIDNRAQVIFSFADFERLYGGLASRSELSYAVAQFYQNAPGQQAYVVRVPGSGAKPAKVTFGDLVFSALSSGTWADGQLLIDVDQGPPVNLATGTGDPLSFNLTVTNLLDGTTEYFPNVTLDGSKMTFVGTVINDKETGSQLVSVDTSGLSTPPTAVVVTGVVSGPVNPTTLAGAIGQGTPSVAQGDWGIDLDTSNPASGTVTGLPAHVTVFAGDTPLPTSVAGIAFQVQRAINAALTAAVPGASAQVSVAPAPAGGQAIRICVTLPNQPDAVLHIGAPTGTNPPQNLTAAAGLGLTSLASSNVAHYALGTGNNNRASQTTATAGSDGSGLPGTSDLIGDQNASTGIYALDRVDLFNLLCIPDATRALSSDPSALDPAVDPAVIYGQAIPYCDQRRAFLLADPRPDVTTVSGAIDWISNTLGITDPNGAAFWPRLRLSDPLNNYNLRSFAPCGVVAGVYATTDGTRGVWKAPAGINATLNGVQSLTYTMTDDENGLLNPLGLNCFRAFPVVGRVLWGARTLRGADVEASQWKYVPVRRLALFLEESLYRGLQWVVFEPNDAPLWQSIRLNVESFMQTLFLKGAFQGTTPAQAFFVKCDSETTTQADIDNGIVNILVGFAPLKPAEFVVIQIEQLTGQASS